MNNLIRLAGQRSVVVLRLLLLIALLYPPIGEAGLGVATQQSSQQQAPRINRPRSDPYRGDLSIFEDAKRAERLQVDRVMDLLGIKEGSNVADIGAGSGWFSVRAARRVGPRGTVFAVDINRDYITYIEQRAVREGLANIRTVLGGDDNPMLPERSVDAVLILKTYHEIAEPIRLLAHLRVSLRPRALVGIIDKNGRGNDHGLNAAVVVKEAEMAGFTLAAEHDFVKADGMDYFLILRASTEADGTVEESPSQAR